MIYSDDKKTLIDFLQSLIDAELRGETVKASFRVYRTDGTYEDIVVGASSEEEHASLLADIESRLKSGTN